MKTTIIVEGLKCHHCEMHAEEAIRKIPGVREVKADHITKEVSIVSDNPINEDSLKKSMEDAGYTYKGIKA